MKNKIWDVECTESEIYFVQNGKLKDQSSEETMNEIVLTRRDIHVIMFVRKYGIGEWSRETGLSHLYLYDVLEGKREHQKAQDLLSQKLGLPWEEIQEAWRPVSTKSKSESMTTKEVMEVLNKTHPTRVISPQELNRWLKFKGLSASCKKNGIYQGNCAAIDNLFRNYLPNTCRGDGSKAQMRAESSEENSEQPTKNSWVCGFWVRLKKCVPSGFRIGL